MERIFLLAAITPLNKAQESPLQKRAIQHLTGIQL
jgi:hypothetical protein